MDSRTDRLTVGQTDTQTVGQMDSRMQSVGQTDLAWIDTAGEEFVQLHQFVGGDVEPECDAVQRVVGSDLQPGGGLKRSRFSDHIDHLLRVQALDSQRAPLCPAASSSPSSPGSSSCSLHLETNKKKNKQTNSGMFYY